MVKMRKITMLLMLLVMVLFSVPSCAPTVSQDEYDRVSNELRAIQSQLSSLQGKLAEAELLETQYKELLNQFNTVKSEFETLQTAYEESSAEYEELNEQFDTVKSGFETMQTEYEELSVEYEELNEQFEELSKQYDVLAEEPAEIIEEDLEQAIFQLVNQDRKNNDLDEMDWGKYLYKDAFAHSRRMATTKRLEYPEFGWQEVYWAVGHRTTDMMANAAFTVWQNRLQYERNFLNATTKYCAVGVYKSGEIFYITYLADYFQ
jgi:archaellum component FlaC